MKNFDDVREFLAEADDGMFSVREEDHDRIGALFCPQHVGAMTKGEK